MGIKGEQIREPVIQNIISLGSFLIPKQFETFSWAYIENNTKLYKKPIIDFL